MNNPLIRLYMPSACLAICETPMNSFRRELRSIGDLPEKTGLPTMGMENPHKDGLRAIGNSILEDATAQLVTELSNFGFPHNHCRFDNDLYFQACDNLNLYSWHEYTLGSTVCQYYLWLTYNNTPQLLFQVVLLWWHRHNLDLLQAGPWRIPPSTQAFTRLHSRST